MVTKQLKYFITCSVAIIALCSLVYGHSKRHALANEGEITFRLKALRSGTIAEWRDIISGAQLNTIEQLQSIDFSLPGAADYGDDPRNEFFNPLGPFKANILSLEHGESPPVFNLRQVAWNNRSTPEARNQQITTLYAIIPVTRSCTPLEVFVASDTKTIMHDQQFVDGCFSSSSGNSYYFVTVATHQAQGAEHEVSPR